MRPLISICIPTYNRSAYLDRTLSTIVSQEIFRETDLIEIVISDNNSIDNTSSICKHYVSSFPKKIKFYSNQVNTGPENVNIVFSKANGHYLKLNNDTLCHAPNSLEIMVAFVKKYFDDQQLIFFTNGLLNTNEAIRVSNLDDFVDLISFYSTWIISFGIWREDYLKILNIDTINSTSLINNVLFDQIILKGGINIVDSKIFTPNDVPQKGGYNIYEVFINNYINILEQYYKRGQLSYKTLFNEKAKLLTKFLIPWEIRFFKSPKLYSFSRTNKFKYLFAKYYAHPVFYLSPFIYLYTLLKFKK